MYETLSQSSNKLSAFILEKSKESTEFEMRATFIRYTLDVIATAAFGLESNVFNESESEFSKMAKKFQDQFGGKNMYKFLILLLAPKLFDILGLPILDKEASDFFSDVVKKTIKHREATGENRDDFLQLLMESRNLDARTEEPGAGEQMETFEKDAQLQKASKIPLSEDHILAQSLLFFVAGFDTIETLLLMAVYELSVNQDVQETLHQELNDIAEKNGGKLTYDSIMQCEYLDMVVSGKRNTRIHSQNIGILPLYLDCINTIDSHCAYACTSNNLPNYVTEHSFKIF